MAAMSGVKCLVVVLALLSVHAVTAKKGPVKRVWFKVPDLYPEGATYDPKHDSFLVGSLRNPDITAIKEDGSYSTFVSDSELEGKAILGMKVDELRNRVVATVSSITPDEIFAAVVAYDLDTAERMLYTRLDEVTSEPLGDPEDPDYIMPPSLANDVAIDAKGNIYATNTLGSLIWKVGLDGAASVLTDDPLFASPPTIYQVPGSGASLGLNGVEYHPKGFLLVGHTSGGALFKVTFSVFTSAVTVTQVTLDEPIPGVDGIVLRSDGKLVAASLPGIYLLESNDNWASAKLVETATLKASDTPTAVALKDGYGYALLAQVDRFLTGKSTSWFELRLVDFKSDVHVKKTSKSSARVSKKGKKSTQNAMPVVLISGGLLALLGLALAKDKQGKQR